MLAFKFSLLLFLEGTKYLQRRETEGQLKNKKEYNHTNSRNNIRSSDAERLHAFHHNLLYPFIKLSKITYLGPLIYCLAALRWTRVWLD